MQSDWFEVASRIFFADDLILDTVLAEGAQAVIYSCHYCRDEDYKYFIFKALKMNEEYLLLVQEAAIQSICSCTNYIAPVIACGFIDGKIGIVMPRFHSSLFDYVTCGDFNFNHNEALHILLTIGYAVTYLHNLCVSHNDIKLKNILIKDNGSVVLADSGIATSLLSVSQTPFLDGTPPYQPPEWKSSAPLPTLDVWPFALMYLELLGGQVLQVDSDIADITSKAYPTNSSAAVDISMQGVLDENPATRSTPAKLCNDLEQMLQDNEESFTSLHYFLSAGSYDPMLLESEPLVPAELEPPKKHVH